MKYNASYMGGTHDPHTNDRRISETFTLTYLLSGGSRISRRGGVDLVGGGVDSRGSYVSKILYVKTKELGPLGGARAGRAAP